MKNKVDELHELSVSIYMSGHGLDREDSDDIAEQLYNEGYRKQSEGEWREDVIAFCNVCSSCRAMVDRSAIKCRSGKLHFCPNCGAMMKGAEYGKAD